MIDHSTNRLVIKRPTDRRKDGKFYNKNKKTIEYWSRCLKINIDAVKNSNFPVSLELLENSIYRCLASLEITLSFSD